MISGKFVGFPVGPNFIGVFGPLKAERFFLGVGAGCGCCVLGFAGIFIAGGAAGICGGAA